MSALENVMIGQHSRMKAGLFGSILRVPSVRKEEKRVREHAAEALEYVGISKRWHDQLAVHLSYGDQRRVEIARALASDPKLLLLDEPTAGMSPSETAETVDLVRSLTPGVTVLMVEHKMNVVLGMADRITVLHYGRKLVEGSPEEVSAHPKVQEVYLSGSL
jgi:branched-chain amino acid transport system ATP-binding protein